MGVHAARGLPAYANFSGLGQVYRSEVPLLVPSSPRTIPAYMMHSPASPTTSRAGSSEVGVPPNYDSAEINGDSADPILYDAVRVRCAPTSPPRITSRDGQRGGHVPGRPLGAGNASRQTNDHYLAR